MSGLQEKIQSAEERRNPGLLENKTTVAIVSRSLLLRRSIARRLGLVGVTVLEYTHFDTLFHGGDSSAPLIVLIDPEGQKLPWEALAALVKLFSPRSRTVLLAASVNAGQAIAAAKSGVAAILVKPYSAEKHTLRVLDLLHEIQKVTPRRLQPRFTPEAPAAVQVDYFPADDWLPYPMGVCDLSLKGARLRLPYGEYAGELQPGSSGFPANLIIGTSRISLRLHVVHREGETVGVIFENLGIGRTALESLVRRMYTQALGADDGDRSRW